MKRWNETRARVRAMYALNTPSTLNFVQPRRGNIVTIEIINYSFGDLFFPEERAISRVVRPTSPRESLDLPMGAAKGRRGGKHGACGPRRRGEASRRCLRGTFISLPQITILQIRGASPALGGDCVLSTQTSMLNTGGQRDKGGEGRQRRKPTGAPLPSARPVSSPRCIRDRQNGRVRVKNERHRRCVDQE